GAGGCALRPADAACGRVRRRWRLRDVRASGPRACRNILHPAFMSSPRFAFSNIAWRPHDDPAIFALLRAHGVTGIEVAPTVVWPTWPAMNAADAADYRRFLSDQGFEVPALQALLYGCPQARLFDDHDGAPLLEHLALVAQIAEALGARVGVLGAPSQRDRGD